MSTLVIFALGTFVTVITLVAVLLVGILEAADPDHSRPEDLMGWEWALVRQAREQRMKAGEQEKAPGPAS